MITIKDLRAAACAAAFALLALTIVPALSARETRTVMTRASGTFDVKLTPQDTTDKDAGIGRLSVAKQFHGDLAGTSSGEMLAVQTGTKDSAGYVALERVTGTLQGRKGTFVLQHNGIANRGTNQLSVVVLPDSGTEQLVGLTGTMNIIITGGKHLYELDYTLPAAQ